jgi:hypothetical protein
VNELRDKSSLNRRQDERPKMRLRGVDAGFKCKRDSGPLIFGRKTRDNQRFFGSQVFTPILPVTG